MTNMTNTEQQRVLDEQIAAWTQEMRRLASNIAFARGTSCAVVLITGPAEAYKDVHPQLVMEDALRVNPHGWPEGFTIDLLNSAD
jgi:hypothetical protein